MIKISTYIFGLLFFAISCNKKIKNEPSKNHLAVIDLNIKLSPLLSKNANPRFIYLLPKLDSVYQNDQKYRDLFNPDYLKKNIKTQKKLDKENQLIIGTLIDSFGYLNSKDVGIIGEKAINLTLLHSDLEFMKKYHPELEEAFKNKKLFVNTYVSFVDKISLKENNFQIYGSQLITYKGKTMYLPLNIDSLHYYRNQLGQPLDTTNYLNAYKRVYIDPTEYKKLLPELTNYYKKHIAPLNN